LQKLFQKLKERIFPSRTTRREYYDKFWYLIGILKYGGIPEFLWEIRKFILIKLNLNIFYIPQNAIRKEGGVFLREEYFRMLFKQTEKQSVNYVKYRNHAFTELPIKLIAFYLPQFHPIPENDEFWGKGFTEWANVSRAIPQFMGHYQPHLPGELGFYDLRLVENIKRQIELAKNYGIFAFCFHHYWFNGKGIMRTPIDLFLKHKEIDFKFCINWANENWTRAWDGLEKQILLKQYHSPEDDIAFIKDTAKYLLDPRYVRINGKPLLIIYRPALFPDPKATANRWREWCRKNGIGEIFLANIHSFDRINPKDIGFDAAIEYPPNTFPLKDHSQFVDLVNRNFKGRILSYDDLIRQASIYKKPNYTKFRGICPCWDNEPRRPGRGTIIFDSDPQKYQLLLEQLLIYSYKNFEKNERIIFINAWNEWAEGTYLEPDKKYGYAYLEATANSLKKFMRKLKGKKIIVVSHDANPNGAQFLALNIIRVLNEEIGFNVVTILQADGILASEFSKHSTVIRWFDLINEEKTSLIEDLYDKGFRKAICNTSATGEIVESLKNAGFELITLIHEMAQIIKEKHLEKSVKNVITYSDLLVFPGKYVLKSFIEIARPNLEKVVFRPQGIYNKNPYINRRKEIRKEVRRKWNLPDKAVIILNVGFADYRKGFDIFIEIGKKIIKQENNVYFVWVGNYEKMIYAKMIKTINQNELDYFIFPGFIDKSDLLKFYIASDIFLLSSREDPFPSVVLEALDAGLPVIGFKGTGSFSEILKEKGGILVPNFDIITAVKEISALINNSSKREKLSREAKEIMNKNFEFKDYVYDLLNFLNIFAPKISVIIPNYNYEKFLKERLFSLFNQSYRPYELIFLDDFSQDRSIETAIPLLSKSNIQFRIFKNAKNEGCFHQWMKGINAAKGDIIWIAEADDSCNSDFFLFLKNFFQDENVNLAYSQSEVIDENSNVINYDYRNWTADISKIKWNHSYCNEGKEEVAEALCIKNTIPNASAVLMRKSALTGIEKYLKQFKTGGDWFTYIYILKKGKICFSFKKLNYHRRHRKSIIARTAASYEHFDDHLKIINFIVENFQLTRSQLEKSLTFLNQEYIKLLSKRVGYKRIDEDPRYSEKIELIRQKIKVS